VVYSLISPSDRDLETADRDRVRAVLRDLLRHNGTTANADSVNSDGMQLSALHDAVDVGDLARVQTLVAAGADIEERKYLNKYYSYTNSNENFKQHTPLTRAAKKGHVPVARYLVECGADKEALTDSETSLHVASREGHIDVVRMLIEHGANKNSRTTNGGWTPLMVASADGRVVVVEYLLEQGCELDTASVSGWTALHAVALSGVLEVAQLLLRFGAQIDVRDEDGDTPFDVATQFGHHDIANAIRAEELRRRDHGFKRDRSTIEGTEEHEASKRPRAEQEAEEAAAAAAAPDESDDDDDDEDDDDEEEG